MSGTPPESSSGPEANHPADLLSRAAADLLGEVVRNTAGVREPMTVGGRALLDRLVAAQPVIPEQSGLTLDAARSMVVVALERVPAAQRGSGWDLLIDAVAAKLFEAESSRAQLEALWHLVLERRRTK